MGEKLRFDWLGIGGIQGEAGELLGLTHAIAPIISGQLELGSTASKEIAAEGRGAADQ